MTTTKEHNCPLSEQPCESKEDTCRGCPVMDKVHEVRTREEEPSLNCQPAYYHLRNILGVKDA